MRETNVVAPYKKADREINELILRQYEKYTSGEITRSKSYSKSYFHLPIGELGGQHIVIFYVVILLYGEQKGSLPGHKLVITWKIGSFV